MKLQKINITQIAEEAGVSIATVSRVLNGRNGVSEDVRRRVNALLRKHNYIGDNHLNREKKIAVVSGSCNDAVLFQAAAAGAEMVVTGEFKHQLYHTARELGINVIAAGHYATETVGVKAVMELLASKFGIEVEFADCPTGL